MALKARLIAERDEKEEMATLAELEKELQDPDVVAIIDGERRIFSAGGNPWQAGSRSRSSALQSWTKKFRNWKVEIVAQKRQLTLINQEISDVETLVRKGLAPRPRLFALQRSEAEIEGARARNRSMVARANQSIGEAILEVEGLKTTRFKEVVAQLPEIREQNR